MRSCGGLAQDHLAQEEQRLVGALAVEHVLGAEQADALGAEVAGHLGVLRRVGVGAHAHRPELVGHGHELLETRIFGGVHHRQGADIDMALGAVQGDDVAFLQDDVGAGDLGRPGLGVDVQGAGADDAALAPAAGDERRVGGHAAAGGEDADGRAHPFDVFGVGLFAQQDALPAGALARPRRPRR